MTTGRAALTGAALPRHTITAAAARTIDSWAWALADGTMLLYQLPDAINTLYNVAYEQGRASRDHEVQTARLDADRLWLRCFGDKDRTGYLLDRLDQAADLANRPDVDDVLDEAWRIYLASLDNIREPITFPVSTEQGLKGAA